MVKRHVVVRDFVCEVGNVALGDLLLYSFFERGIEALLPKLKQINIVVLKLQLHSCKMGQFPANIDTVLDVFPTVEVRLNQSAGFDRSPVFESAVTKIECASSTISPRLRGVQCVVCC